MKRFKVVTMLCCATLMSVALAPSAKADDWNRKTVVTFGSPVEIPGVHLAGWAVLPAGTYVFKIMDSMSDRHIVQIFSQDEKTIYATILAIPNYRLQATDKTVITFRERPVGQPEALRAWFYPGSTSGEEFVYPKTKAVELAKASNTPVLFTPTESPFEVAQPIKSMDEPLVIEMKQMPIMAIKPTGEQVELTEVVTPPPAQTGVATPELVPMVTGKTLPSTTEKTLPSTASSFPLMGLFGLIFLAGAFAIRIVAKRFQ